MDKNAPLDSDLAAAALDPAEPVPRPVRSAKDAINAMYAQSSEKPLSDYLAKSAKEIINSGGHAVGDSKSAANLHRKTSKKRLDMARPSASGMLRSAQVEETPVVEDVSHAMDPLAQKTSPTKTRPAVKPAPRPATPTVIKTSLRLAPKKTPAARPQTLQKHSSTGLSLNGQKGSTTLSKMWAERRTAAKAVPKVVKQPVAQSQPATEEVRIMQDAVKKVTQQSAPRVSKPVAARTARGRMQDVIRQPRNVDGIIRPDRSNSAQPSGRPLDSVKRRFRTVPKDYVAAPEIQPETYQGFEDEPVVDKPPVEIYGLMDEEPTGKGNSNLGVVEDYHPQGDKAGSTLKEQKIAAGSGFVSTPDNNKYALGGSSPFFLKSVNVEKRPLSEASRPSKSTSEGTLYERPATTPVNNKNLYEKKEPRKPLPTKPTVIIPAARKSKAPLIFLIILTIILGAAVGAFVYLCFFQYME